MILFIACTGFNTVSELRWRGKHSKLAHFLAPSLNGLKGAPYPRPRTPIHWQSLNNAAKLTPQLFAVATSYKDLYSETSEQRAPEERASSEQRPTWMERIAFPIETVNLQPPKSGTSELRPTAKSCVPKCKSLIQKTLWKRPRSHAQLKFFIMLIIWHNNNNSYISSLQVSCIDKWVYKLLHPTNVYSRAV